MTAAEGLSTERTSLFRDVQSMQFFVRSLARHQGSEYPPMCSSWHDHDPQCPFPWLDVADWLLDGSPSPEEEARRGMMRIIDRSKLKPEVQEKIARLQQQAAKFEFIPPYNSFIYRDDYDWSRPPGAPVEPTSAQMLEALRRCPYARDIRTFLIVTTGQAGLWQTADSLLRAAEEAEPDEWQWKKLRGLLLGWQGRYDEAAAHWATCPQTQRDGKPVYVTFYDDVNRGSRRNLWGWKRSSMPVEAMRGYDLTRAGRYEEAADVLEPAVRKYGDRVSPGLDMMVCAAMYAMCQSRQPERAIAAYPHDVPAERQTEERRYHLARAYFLAGNRTKARRILHDVQSLASRFYGRSRTSFLPPHMEIDRFRRQLQHHRSLFGL
jgi:tetratricopeptide (TPR) repeat protein